MDNFTLINNTIDSFIKNKVKEGNVGGVIFGLSGGIDSTLVAFLATKALGNKNVLGLLLPDKEITPQQDIDDAMKICSILKIPYKIIYVNKIKNEFLNTLGKTDDRLVEGNLVSRIRMNILYYYANFLNKMVLGTTNKTEITTGYFTKYGDGASDLSPIGCLYKTQVREFAKFLNIPNQIIYKKSSARLWANQQTEDDIGLLFDELDKILIFINKQKKDNIDLSLLEENFPSIPKEKINHILYLIKKNKHKYSSSTVCALS